MCPKKKAQCCGLERVFVEGHDWGAEVAPSGQEPGRAEKSLANAPDLLATPPVIAIIDFLETHLHCRLGLLKKNFNLMLKSSKKLGLPGP
ncbi:hypothetical protein NC652_023830 [Populus alba x Populus x berolinensis]|nr:hypothetical protein NC652_023830 [Populus alba x Populus x berolinensis]